MRYGWVRFVLVGYRLLRVSSGVVGYDVAGFVVVLFWQFRLDMVCPVPLCFGVAVTFSFVWFRPVGVR